MDNQIPFPVSINDEEKKSEVMVYTDNVIAWGTVVLKNKFRASTWLITNAAPDVLHLFNGKAISFSLQGTPTPVNFGEMFIPLANVLAFHLLPPNFDPLDYDPNEPNMQTLPIKVHSGSFIIDGNLRISTRANLSSYLDILHQAFLALYDATISTPKMPLLGNLKVPHALVRKDNSVISSDFTRN